VKSSGSPYVDKGRLRALKDPPIKELENSLV
jgi:hypothetical protein